MEQKWTWDEKTKTVTIFKNDTYMLGISEDQYITIKVEVESGSTKLQQESECGAV